METLEKLSLTYKAQGDGFGTISTSHSFVEECVTSVDFWRVVSEAYEKFSYQNPVEIKIMGALNLDTMKPKTTTICLTPGKCIDVSEVDVDEPLEQEAEQGASPEANKP